MLVLPSTLFAGIQTISGEKGVASYLETNAHAKKALEDYGNQILLGLDCKVVSFVIEREESEVRKTIKEGNPTYYAFGSVSEVKVSVTPKFKCKDDPKIVAGVPYSYFESTGKMAGVGIGFTYKFGSRKPARLPRNEGPRFDDVDFETIESFDLKEEGTSKSK